MPKLHTLYPNVQIACSGSQDGMNLSSYLLDPAGEYLDLISVHAYWLSREHELKRYDYMTAISKSEIADGEYAAVILAGDSVDAFNDIGHPDRVTLK